MGLGEHNDLMKRRRANILYGSVVQSVERRTVNPYVAGSSPASPAMGLYASGLSSAARAP